MRPIARHNPALSPSLVDEPSSIRLVSALLRGRPMDGAMVQGIIMLLLLGVGCAVRSRLMLLPPCTAPRPQEPPEKGRTRVLRAMLQAQALQAHDGETCLGGLPRDAAAAAHVCPARRGLSFQCLHWHGLRQHTSSGRPLRATHMWHTMLARQPPVAVWWSQSMHLQCKGLLRPLHACKHAS